MIKIEELCYSYRSRRNVNEILRGISYEFECSKYYVMTGKSGSGKTTLLSLIAGLDQPSSGAVLFNGTNIRNLDLDKYRAGSVGVIFQNYNLLSYLNAIENVQLALRLSGKGDGTYLKAEELLWQVGIGGSTAKRRVMLLSGGEQQRVAIARALAGEPEVIIADEPTGNLDEGNQNNIIDIFQSLAHEHGKCVIIASHSPEVIKRADQILQL